MDLVKALDINNIGSFGWAMNQVQKGNKVVWRNSDGDNLEVRYDEDYQKLHWDNSEDSEPVVTLNRNTCKDWYMFEDTWTLKEQLFIHETGGYYPISEVAKFIQKVIGDAEELWINDKEKYHAIQDLKQILFMRYGG